MGIEKIEEVIAITLEFDRKPKKKKPKDEKRDHKDKGQC
jgi:hypothetical protein